MSVKTASHEAVTIIACVTFTVPVLIEGLPDNIMHPTFKDMP